MNVLRSLKNNELLAATSRLALEERRITLAVLGHFREIERRKAYADLGYRSLFEYALTHLRYSEGSASRRISAMYALKEHPELGEQIAEGKATVTSIARIHTTIRRDEKMRAQKWSSQDKKKTFQAMAALPAKDLERELFAVAPAATVQEKTRPIGEDLHEVKIYLSSADLAALEELRAVMGQRLINPGSNSELIQRLIRQARDAVKEKEAPEASTKSAKLKVACRSASPLVGEISSDEGKSSKAREAPDSQTSDSEVLGPGAFNSKAVPARTRKLVFQRADQPCQFLLPDGKRCDSRSFLQIEHRRPRGRGGSNALSNLEVLCRAHNQIRGIKAFGPERMQRD